MGINKNTPEGYARTWCDDNGEGNLITMQFLNNRVTCTNIDAIVTQRLSRSLNSVSILDIGIGWNRHTGNKNSEGLEAIGIYFNNSPFRESYFVAEPDALTIKHFLGCGKVLPFESNSFDFVCCGDIAVNFVDFRNIIGELSRVLKKGGVFFYDTINRTSVSNFIVQIIMRELKGISIPDPTETALNDVIQAKDLLKMLDEHYLVNKGKCSTPETSYSFHYYNLRKREKEPKEYIRKPYLNFPNESTALQVDNLK